MSNISSQTQYRDLVTSIKEQIRTAKSNVTLSINRQLVALYFSISYSKDSNLAQLVRDLPCWHNILTPRLQKHKENVGSEIHG